MNKQIVILGIIFCAVASLLIYGAFSTNFFAGKPSDNLQTPSNQRLLETNPQYVSGEQLRQEGNLEEAILKYQEALLYADRDDKGQVDYKVALSKLEWGAIPEGIEHLKRIAANTEYNNFVRSYAVSAMGNFYYARREQIYTDEIFKDGVYKSFYDPNDVNKSYRRLYEYASSFQPTAISELRIARWYSSKILHLQSTPSSDSQEIIEEYKKIIRKNLAVANQDHERIIRFDRKSIVPVLFNRAIVLSDLSISGDDSFGNPETVFDTALDYLAKNPSLNSEMVVSFYKANYLSRKANPNVVDIKKLLSRIYNEPNIAQTNFYISLRNERNENAANTELRRDSVNLSAIDPKFKAFLVELGWKL
ncbi:MAG: hypothetical protein DDT23_00745 [candidate division WS2 bacterium]|nr:hypothetical protein [Candidatus Lithacetigena glycinireducens]